MPNSSQKGRAMAPLPLPGGAVWVASADAAGAGYVEATFVEQRGEKVVVEVAPSGQREVARAEMRAVCPGPSVPDLTTLVVLNEATMLHNLRERFGRDRIYTRASSMLVVRLPTHRTPARARPLTRRPF